MRHFPADFTWGAATSAYQIEGAARTGGRGPSIWDTFAREPGRVLHGDTGDIACDHYHRFPEDVGLLGQLGVTAYRFSISWPRVQPDGRGPVNTEGLDFYSSLVDALLEYGITPLVTLYHWDLPVPLSYDGGWLSRNTAGRFADYATACHERLGDRVTWWTTLNEPWCSSFLAYAAGRHAPGRTNDREAFVAAHHQLLAHGRATGALRDAAPEAAVGITLNFADVVPASDDEADADAARRVDAIMNRMFLEPIVTGEYPDEVLDLMDASGASDAFADGDLHIVGEPIDFLGVNYYTRHRVLGGSDRQPGSPWAGCDDVAEEAPAHPVTGMGWEICPDGLGVLLARLHRDAPGLPLYITENGAAFPDYANPEGEIRDPARVGFLDAHLREVHAAINDGIDVRGYFVWSLLDNFEWAEGYSQRFGLVYVDYPSQQRRPKDSFWWYADVIASGGLLDRSV